MELCCKFCNYKTLRTDNLNRHILLKHTETKDFYKCDYCDCNFTTLYSKQRHVNKACRHSQNVVQNYQNVVHPSQNVVQNYQNVVHSSQNIAINTSNDLIVQDNSTCQFCNKTFFNKYNKLRHEEKCKGLDNSLECSICHKMFANRFSKSKHMKTCFVIVENNNQQLPQVTNINNPIHSNNNNINSFNNSINIITFNTDKTKRLLFRNDHISKEEMDNLIHEALQSNPDEFEKEVTSRYCSALLEHPDNQCVKKTNLRANYSKVHVGDNKWAHKHDSQVYPKLVSDLSECLFEYIHSNKNNMTISQCLIKALDIFVNYMADNGFCNEDKETAHKVLKSYKDLVQFMKNLVFDFTTNLSE